MKKVLIVTINGNVNYGNRLQNYALFRKLNSFSSCKNLWIVKDKKYFLKLFIKKLFPFSKKYKREMNFVKFNKNINTLYKYNINTSDADYYVVGSDQVWNPQFALTDLMLLKNIEDKKKISYAASIGVNELNKNAKIRIKDELLKFNYISVREDKAKEIIEDLTGRKDVEVLIDPTMLLTKKEWDNVSKKPTMLKTDKYILNYFLGNLSAERKREIERVAKEHNCEMINILDKNSPFYECGPSEFLYIEKHAFLICTDSFHSSVFAFIYNRPFIIFDREQKGMENMASRLDTLITKFKLKDRRYNGKKITSKNLEHDYTEGYKILEEERKKSDAFLRQALDIKDVK